MLKITLENGSAYEVLHETACYPSMSTTARSYLEIHMSADAMTLDEFYTLMTDSEATKKITLQNIDAETRKEYTNIYADFTYPRSIGKQCVTKVIMRQVNLSGGSVPRCHAGTTHIRGAPATALGL